MKNINDINNYDIIIVGGGITGLIGSAMLSRTGKKVLLIERLSQCGGMFKMIKSGEDEFFLGAHHIAGICENSITGDLLTNVGIDLQKDIEKVKYISVIINKKTFTVPLDLDELYYYIKNNYTDEEKVDEFFKLINKYKDFFISGDEKGLLNMFIKTSKISYIKFLKQYFNNDEIIQILSSLGPGYGGVGPKGVAFNNLSLLISYGIGSGYFKENNSKIISSLISFINDNGGMCVTNTECVDVILDNKCKQIEGVICKRNGIIKRYYSNKVLFCMYPFNILNKYLIGTRLWKKMSNFNPGASTIRVYGLVEETNDLLMGDTVYMGNYDLDELDNNILLEKNATRLPICMLHINKKREKVKFMFTFQVKPNNEKRILKEKLLDLIRKEFPEILNNAKDISVLYDKVYKSITNTEWGSVFGWERTPYNYMNTNLYAPVLHEIKGVYVAGNWSTDYGVYGALRTLKKSCDIITK